MARPGWNGGALLKLYHSVYCVGLYWGVIYRECNNLGLGLCCGFSCSFEYTTQHVRIALLHYSRYWYRVRNLALRPVFTTAWSEQKDLSPCLTCIFRAVDIQDYIYYQLIALGHSWRNVRRPVDRDYRRITVLVFFCWILRNDSSGKLHFRGFRRVV
jgi:hypothetical protein